MKSHEIIQIPVTPEMLALAEAKARKMGVLNRHSMMKGERNIEGILGELGALKYLRNAVATESYDHDLAIGRLTIDVKTKRLKNRPRLDYDCTVYGYNPNQNCHLYLFAGVNPEHTLIWLNGFIKKTDFYEKAEFCPAGTERPLGPNKTLIYKEDNYVIQIEQLRRVEDLNNLPTVEQNA